MKLLKRLSHPYLLLILFCGLLISGKSFGGFYLLYILMAAKNGLLYGWLGIGGIILLIFTKEWFRRRKIQPIESILNIIGAFLLLSSLAWFFVADKAGYNLGTFEQPVPMLMLGLFGVCWILFVAWNIIPGALPKKDKASRTMLA